MPLYHWKGIDSSGKLHRGQLYASDTDELKELLLKEHVALLELQQSRASFFNFFKKRQISDKELMFFFEYMSIFLESGVDIAQALTLCRLQKNNTLYQNVIIDLIKEIKSGKLLSDAMAIHQGFFSPFMIHVVSIGEHTGQLSYTFKRLARYLQMREELKAHIKKATLLPLFTLFFAFIIVGGLFLFVIPQFAVFFESMNKPIPGITQNLIAVSFFLRSPRGILLGICVLVIGFFAPYIWKWKRTKILIDTIIVRLCPIFLLPDLVSFLETLELCLSTGIPLHETLQYAQYSVKNLLFQKKIEESARAVAHGSMFNHAVAEHGAQFFPKILVDMLALGEQTGTLPTMITKIKNLFQSELDKKLSLFITFIQPTLLIIVGIIIAGLMVSLYLPIFNLVDTL